MSNSIRPFRYRRYLVTCSSSRLLANAERLPAALPLKCHCPWLLVVRTYPSLLASHCAQRHGALPSWTHNHHEISALLLADNRNPFCVEEREVGCNISILPDINSPHDSLNLHQGSIRPAALLLEAASDPVPQNPTSLLAGQKESPIRISPSLLNNPPNHADPSRRPQRSPMPSSPLHAWSCDNSPASGELRGNSDDTLPALASPVLRCLPPVALAPQIPNLHANTLPVLAESADMVLSSDA